MRSPGKPISKETILQEVWGYKQGLESTALKNGVLRLRKKIEHDPRRPDHLITVRGVGYRLTLDSVETRHGRKESVVERVEMIPGAFDVHKEARAKSSSRLMCLMSLFAFVSFLLVDPFMGGDSLWRLAGIRGFFVLGGLGIYGITFVHRALPSYLLAAHLITLWTGIGVTFLTFLTGGISSLYWTMMMLIFFITSLVHPDSRSRIAFSYVGICVFFLGWMAVFDTDATAAEWAIATGGICLAACLSLMATGYNRKPQAPERQAG